MRVVTTAFHVLEQVALHQPVGVSELARTLDLPKSNVQRALGALQDLGWVEQETGGSRRWVQTTKLLTLASRGGGLSLRERAMPIMRELYDATDENVHLSVRSGFGMAVIEKLDSGRTVRPFDPLGIVAPIHASSTGKAVLAWSDQESVDEVIRHGMENFTRHTVVDAESLRRELRNIRRTGYAVNRGEWQDDVRGVAAPILDTDANPRAAISVAVPTHRLPDRAIPALGRLVAETVARLSAHDGHAQQSERQT